MKTRRDIERRWKPERHPHTEGRWKHEEIQSTGDHDQALKNYRKGGLTFSEALHRAWITAKAANVNAERIRKAAAAAGITEAVNTWAGWKAAGREVIHQSKALFKAVLIWGSRGDGATYTGSFFGISQTRKA